MFAYGLSVPTLGDHPPPPATDRLWHLLDLEQQRGPAPSATARHVGDETAVLSAAGLARIDVQRHPLRSVITAATALETAVIVHPVLSFIGAVAARWVGRSAFHAASVVLDDGAWVLLGPAGSGKTTLATQLDASGLPVLADDLSVVDGHLVLAGPRWGDLREPTATKLKQGRALSTRVGRVRYRHQFAAAPLEVPLAGFVSLQWSDEFSVEPVPVADRLGVLARGEAFRLAPTAHRGFLDLLVHPMWRLSRPQDWDSSERAIAALVQLGATI